jgi:MoaA/NifB/PqqE/SkfB family radical SAM enzyme
MNTVAAKTWDMLRLLRRGGPALCNIAVTNSCNASCDFCNFARGKVQFPDQRWIDAGQFDRALDILRQRDVRYVSFFGGEPLLHPRLTELIAMAIAKDMGPALITNGWLLPQKVDALAEAGLKTVYISIDAASMAAHETNRGLKGLGERIKSATSRMRELGVTPLAQVTMSKLIGDPRYHPVNIYYRGMSKEEAYREMKHYGFKDGWGLRGLKSYFEKHSQAPFEQYVPHCDLPPPPVTDRAASASAVPLSTAR